MCHALVLKQQNLVTWGVDLSPPTPQKWSSDQHHQRISFPLFPVFHQFVFNSFDVVESSLTHIKLSPCYVFLMCQCYAIQKGSSSNEVSLPTEISWMNSWGFNSDIFIIKNANLVVCGWVKWKNQDAWIDLDFVFNELCLESLRINQSAVFLSIGPCVQNFIIV